MEPDTPSGTHEPAVTTEVIAGFFFFLPPPKDYDYPT